MAGFPLSPLTFDCNQLPQCLEDRVHHLWDPSSSQRDYAQALQGIATVTTLMIIADCKLSFRRLRWKAASLFSMWPAPP